MEPLNYPAVSQNLVNYTIIPTQASNEIYIPETDAPDSIAFLMRNNVIIELSPLIMQANPNSQNKDVL